MTRTAIAVLAVAAVAFSGSAARASDWNGLIVGEQYLLSVSESPLTLTGTIRQYDASNNNIAYTGAVRYCLPDISVSSATVSPFWAVCIDTRELSADQEGAVLMQGWGAGSTPLTDPGRLNGTVLDANAWAHTTYLFSQFGPDIGDMTDVQKQAFQLATWEVMSGDGIAGADWNAGSFTATNVSGSVLTQANAYVAAAYNDTDNAFTDWVAGGGANSSLYFSGVFNTNIAAYQDYLVYAPAEVPNIPPVVPEIPAALLCPLGLLAIGAIRRRFTK